MLRSFSLVRAHIVCRAGVRQISVASSLTTQFCTADINMPSTDAPDVPASITPQSSDEIPSQSTARQVRSGSGSLAISGNAVFSFCAQADNSLRTRVSLNGNALLRAQEFLKVFAILREQLAEDPIITDQQDVAKEWLLEV